METILQPSSLNLRSKVAAIEAIELACLGFLFWLFSAIININNPNLSFLDQLGIFVVFQAVLLGSWLIYNAYIRIARAGGRRVDIALWIAATVLTSSYTFWAWSILDVNRWLISRFFYRGEAPVEYAWSARSKQIRKAWEQMRKAGTVS
jgi:flagellar biosynthesis protein FliQ